MAVSGAPKAVPGLNFAAALVKNEFERHALRLQMLGDGERA